MQDIRKKAITAFKKLLIYFITVLLLPVIFCVRFLRPFVLIRFGSLISTRIGHYAGNTELYLCEKDVGLQPKNTIDIFFNDRIICNNQLKKMWDRTLNVCQITRLQRPLYLANSILPGSKKHIISLPTDRDIHNLFERTPLHLVFTPEEEQKGYKCLSKLDVSNGSKFVCFHARDSEYLAAKFPKRNWNYHQYRDVNINNFIEAAVELTERGYYAIRMGVVQKKFLKPDSPSIIDYLSWFRTDFMDIFLISKCYFFLGDGCGLTAVSYVFRRPTVITNMIPLAHTPTWGKNYLVIPKKLWLKKDRRLMTFREILESGVGRFLRTQQYEQAGIEVIENTSNEIKDVAIEMDERLKGTWQTTEEDEALQQRFWSLFKSSDWHGVIRSRIGRDFLRQNKDLLE